jgi:uncharacterized repeat protein (TIGR03803 family)
MDGAGNLYGAASGGGARNSGVVFELTPSGTGWSEQVLYSFCSQCADGNSPSAGLIMDGAGNLYGTTGFGGAPGPSCPSSYGCGVAFELTPTTNGWTETVLHSFCSQSNCADGNQPSAGLIMDGSGNLYGTTYQGGNNWGVVFELTLLSNNTLSVSVVGSPGGRVTSSPSGINCGSTCGASFAAGTQVTLTASPATAWGLAGWGGSCSGIGGCSVTMSANTSVSATFSTLFSVEAAPVVTSDPALLPAVVSPIPQSQ